VLQCEAHTPALGFISSNCWDATSVSAYDWNIDGAGSTPSTGTGPTAAFSGVNYFYIESSTGAIGDLAELYSPNVDLSALTVPSLEFYYHMFGADMGDLYVDVFDGSWNTVDSIKGEQQAAQTDPWLKRTINLSAFTGVVQIRFRAFCAGTIEGDISLDDIEVKEAPSCFDPTNLTATNITATSADLGWTENGTATNWEIEWGTAGFVQGAGTSVITGTNPHNLSSLTAITSYDFYVRAICGAADTSTWSGPYNFTTLCATIVAPWMDSLETHTPTTTLVSSNCWNATSVSGYDWNIDGAGSTPSTATGPMGAYSGTNYFYIEASNGAVGDVAELLSPDIDVSALNMPTLEFYYHMFGNSSGEMGSLFVDIWDGSTWTTLDSIIGQKQTAQTDPWVLRSVDVSAFTGIVQVKFRAISAGTFHGDISLDDIAINEGCSSPFTINLGPDTNACSVDTVTLDAFASGPYSYAWSTGETTPNINVDTTSLGGNGTYNIWVTVTDTLTGCISIDTIVVDFSPCGGVNTSSDNVNMNVYPNPNKGMFTLNVNTTDVKELEIKVVNIQGQVIYTKNNFNNISKIKVQIDLSDNAKGIYFLIVTSERGIKTQKILVQ
jgi:hypothetical protein